MESESPVTLNDVDADEIEELSIVVPAPTDGAEPFEAVKVGVAGEIALNNKYCFTVAPDPGKMALVHERSI